MHRTVFKYKVLPALLALWLLTAPAAHAAESYVLRTGGSAVLADSDAALLVPAGIYSDIVRLSDDDLFSARPVGGDGCGLLNGAGEALTEFIYDQLSFTGEEIIFSLNGLYGAMDKTGQILIEALYTRLVPMGNGAYLALKSDPLDDSPDALTAISPDGQEKSTGIRLMYGPFAASQGLSAAVASSGLYGYLSAEGDWAIEPQFVWADTMHFGRARASTEAGMGLIDSNGQWLIEPQSGRLVISERHDAAPVLLIDEGGVSLLSPSNGALIARWEGAFNAAFTGEVICIENSEHVLLIDYQGNVLLSLGNDAESAAELEGYYIVRCSAQSSAPFALLSSDGTEIGRWQELTFAGLFNGVVYAAFSTYDTEAADIDGMTFRDEVPLSRRYGLIDMEGNVIIDNLTSLKATGHALLTAETDDWIGLIRPDGTMVIRLDKEE